MASNIQRNVKLCIGPLLLLSFFVSCGCAAEAAVYQKESPRIGTDSPPLSREDAVREVVFKYQIERMASALKNEDIVFFLSVGGETNPSDGLLVRFASQRPPVKRVSESVSKEYEGIVDKETGRKGILFRVTSIKWASETEAEVEGGYYAGPLAASGHLYRVRFENGKWVVKDDEMKWIS